MPGLRAVLSGTAGESAWKSVAGRLSQLGLSMALNVGAEAIFFGFVYAVVKRQGIALYQWGQCEEQEEVETLDSPADGSPSPEMAAIDFSIE